MQSGQFPKPKPEIKMERLQKENTELREKLRRLEYDIDRSSHRYDPQLGLDDVPCRLCGKDKEHESHEHFEKLFASSPVEALKANTPTSSAWVSTPGEVVYLTDRYYVRQTGLHTTQYVVQVHGDDRVVCLVWSRDDALYIADALQRRISEEKS